MQKEIFYLAYHLHWSPSEILNLDLAERRTFVRLLAERIEEENEEVERIKREWNRG